MSRFFADRAAAPLSAAEDAAVQRLLDGRGRLVCDGPLVDIKSEAGYAACIDFLGGLDAAAQTLGVRPVERAYRSTFTANYRALFPDGNRHYRIDILEASIEQQFDICVNGQTFELDSEAIQSAQALQAAWVELLVVLDRAVACQRPAERAELTGVLGAMDAAWAAFEQRYITALIAIEEQARQLVVRAVTLEQQLPRDLHAAGEEGDTGVDRSFVDCLAHLNAIANFNGRGRDDLRLDVLESAREVLRQGGGSAAPGPPCRGWEAAEILAGDVVASYTAMRTYMRKVSLCLEHVDPHLCNNPGLVARLADYEESWEVGARYVRQAKLLHAICDVFAEVRVAERLAPELSTMLEDCDVELFMVLPRLVVLCFLADPLGRRAELVRTLLPHRFGPAGEGGTLRVEPELKALYGRYKETVRLLGACSGGPESARAMLVQQAVRGSEGADLGETLSAEAHRATRELLLSVETWSLELQRHCPADWNQCSAVLVHCLTGGTPKTTTTTKFQV